GLTLLALFLFLAAASGLWLYWSGAKGTGPGRPSFFPRPSAFQGDPSQATTQLVTAVNDRLGSLGVLKLLTEPVDVEPVTAQGRIFPGYHESFRLPARFTPDALADLISQAAGQKGARLLSQAVREDGADQRTIHDYAFGFEPDWVPLRVSLVEVHRPKVCLIIDDGGYQKGKALATLYQFKVPVTVSVIPDVTYSRELAGEMPSHGVEVMCHMPMQGHEEAVRDDYKEFLRLGMRVGDVEEQVGRALDDLPGCVGLNNHMGSQATEDEDLMLKVCQVLKARGLYLIDSRTTARSVEADEAVKVHLVHAQRDVFLDNVETPEAIRAQLDRLVRVARRHGTAVGIGHFKLTTLETLRDAIPAIQDGGVVFVYASEVVQ
ncbi:MAG TPA: divergent polysaccharide deacetylase family protein, partial [bacterium]|nr:divergent polysaccharide deacetylase family protein [bacterium]